MLLLWGCQVPPSRCTADRDCDARRNFCDVATGYCKPQKDRPPDAGPGLDSRCVLLGSQSEDTSTTLIFGALLPKTRPDGTEDPRGRLRQQAIELVVENLNPPLRQGIGGRNVQVISCDTSGNAITGAELAAHLVSRGAVAIISAGSAETLAESSVTIPAGVLLMSSSATSPEITALPDRASDVNVGLVWRTAPTDAFQGKVISAQLATDGGVSPCVPATVVGNPKVAVIELDDPYGQGLYQTFRREYPGAQQAFLYSRQGDVTGAVTLAQAYLPQVVVVIAFPDDGVRILNAARVRPAFSSVAWFFTDSVKAPSLFALESPAQIEGACGTAPASAPTSSEGYLWFGQQYAQKFGEDPQSASFVVNTYDAIMLLALSATWAAGPGGGVDGTNMAIGLTRLSNVDGGTRHILDPPSLNAAITSMTSGLEINVQGASGDLDFDNATGEAPANIEVWRVRDGGFVSVATVSP